jgi:hypothetical protein
MRFVSATLLCLALVGCQLPQERAGTVASAEFGVFFGGQIQERDQIPFSVDRTRQRQGFRLEFAKPLAAAVTVKWELDMPGTTRAVRDVTGRRGAGRLVKLGQADARAGARTFDQELPFVPGDPLGTWNLRVTVGGELVIDRPFLVYEPVQRRRAQRERAEEEQKAAVKGL